MPHPKRFNWKTATGVVAGLLPALASSDIYRWTDAEGATHYSDRAPPGAEVIARSTATETASVREVSDGDTLVLDDGRRLRLIGIDAPELAHRGRPAEPGAIAARDVLRSLVAGQEIALEAGATRRDRYRRLLAYVSVREIADVGQHMLREGLAFASIHEDNAERAQRYFRAEAEARAARRGLWSREPFQPMDAAQAIRHRNSFRQLRDRIARVQVREHSAELTLASGLRVIIDADSRPRFEATSLRALRGVTVVVGGIVRQRDGEAVIFLRAPQRLSPA